MADRYLLESGAPDGYLLEDGSGVLILEAGTAAALDGGEEAGWLNLPGVIAGAVLVAGAIASGNARAATVNHQDEIPYVTGNGVRYSQPYTQRAQVKPVFIQMGGGDELPVSAAPSFVDDTTPPVIFPKIEIPLPAPVWDDPQLCRIQVEENEWVNPFVVPQIVVAPTFGHQDEYQTAAAPTFPPSEEDWSFQNLSKDSVDGIIWVTDDNIAPAFAVEEIGWRAEWLIPKPFTEVFWTTDEIPTAAAQPQGGGGVVYDEISIFRWYQEDPLPVTATPLGIDEEPWKPPVLSLEGPKWQYFPDEVIGPEAINGTSATINANDTSNASGTTTIVGSATNTNNDDTSNASGTTTIVGTSTTTNADDTSNASGSIGGAVSGDSATTNNDDTSSANGTTTIVGTSSTTNENDTNSATGTPIVNGSAADTNNNDTSAASGSSGTPPAGGTHTLPMTGVGPS